MLCTVTSLITNFNQQNKISNGRTDACTDICCWLDYKRCEMLHMRQGLANTIQHLDFLAKPDDWWR